MDSSPRTDVTTPPSTLSKHSPIPHTRPDILGDVFLSRGSGVGGLIYSDEGSTNTCDKPRRYPLKAAGRYGGHANPQVSLEGKRLHAGLLLRNLKQL